MFRGEIGRETEQASKPILQPLFRGQTCWLAFQLADLEDWGSRQPLSNPQGVRPWLDPRPKGSEVHLPDHPARDTEIAVSEGKTELQLDENPTSFEPDAMAVASLRKAGWVE